MSAILSQLQLNEPSLLPNSAPPKPFDHSFDQKLRSELERLGIGFLPGVPFFNFSSSAINLFSDIPKSEPVNLFSREPVKRFDYERTGQLANRQTGKPVATNNATDHRLTANGLFGQQLQDLLLRTGWLVPNLPAQLPFYQAFLEGKLLANLDLQFLVDQILEQVKLVKEKGKVELTLGLKPEELGEILLILTSRRGMVSIEIRSPEETKKLLEAKLEELKSALKKAKIPLAEIIIKEVKNHA